MEKKQSVQPAVISALILFLVLTAVQVLSRIFFKEGLPSWSIYIYCVLQLVIFIVPSVILKKRHSLSFRRFFQLRPYKSKWILPTLLAAACASIGAALVNLLLYSLPFSYIFKSSSVTFLGEGNGFALFLAFSLIPAVFEELYIHGAVMSSLQEKGIGASVFISAFIFAMLHSSAANFLGPFLAAVIYGFLTVVYQSVWPAVIAHFLNNIFSGSLSALMDKYINIGMNGYVVFILAALLLLLVFLEASILHKQLKTVRTFAGTPEPINKRFPVSLGIFAFLWVLKITLEITNII